MIRQAISCDICASEKKQTNHWFVAFEQGGELRLSGWNSRNRLRQGMKHLCGQICLHKLVDEFMARTIDLRTQTGCAEETVIPAHSLAAQGALTLDPELNLQDAPAAEDSAGLQSTPDTAAPRRIAFKAPTELVAVPPRQAAPSAIDTPAHIANSWRAEAWDREREREMRAVGLRADGGRRRSGS